MKLVLFDCDGTLADSQGSISQAMDEAFEGERLTPPGRVRTREVVGLSVPEAIAHLAPAAAPEVRQRLGAAFRAAAQRIRLAAAGEDPLYEGADEAIRGLALRDDCLLGMATGKSRRGVDRLITHYGWHGLFATLQTADDNPSKPHPGMIKAALAETGAERAQAIMIGDTTFDMAMARAAGVMAVGVKWGYHPVEALRAAGANVIVEDFRALMAVIDEA